MQWILLAAVRAYQVVLGPIFGGQCRFYPSCSHYTYEAIERLGARRGVWLGVRRLLRCHPLAKGGFDPVPEKTLHGDARKSEHVPDENRVEATL